MNELSARWRRSWIAWPDGRRDDVTEVDWVQGPTFFADLRTPAGRPSFAQVRGLADLDEAHIGWLVRQDAFAGRLTFDGTHFEWVRAFDYRDDRPAPDSGSLHMERGHMIEIGRDTPYVEHWVRSEPAAAPVGALRLRGRDDGCEAYLARAGEWFAFARNRLRPLAIGSSLAEDVACASLEEARALVDCEVSIGRVTSQGWRILRSSLPFREGALLFAASNLNTERLVASDVDRSGDDVLRHWLVVEAEGEASAFAPPGAAHFPSHQSCASKG